MRKVNFQMLMCVDGYFEGPAGELGWHVVDGEFLRSAVDLPDSADTLLFGRVTCRWRHGRFRQGACCSPAGLRKDNPDDIPGSYH